MVWKDRTDAERRMHATVMKPDWQFIVRFKSEEEDMKAMDTLGRIDKIFYDDRGDNYLNRKQFDALQELGLKYDLIAAPRGYKPPAAKALRK